uniref:AAA+ ATPase domain-containing protein n=1 Tax=viral metagenome TaxID=1070528 RepID=A0A6C0D9U6_9ZZZZ
MQINDFLITSTLLGKISNLNTGNYIFDIFLIINGFIFLYVVNNQRIIDNIINFFKDNNSNKNVLLFEATDKDSSHRFRALSHYISTNCNIKKVKEVEIKKYDWNDDMIVNAGWRVNQTEPFSVTDKIMGVVKFKEIEKSINSNVKTIEEINCLEIYSDLSVKEMMDFVDNTAVVIHNKFLEKKINDNKLIVDILWNEKDKCVKVESCKWESNVKFENRFFKDKEKIINKINFFLDNNEWYKKKGIPHTFGFLLWGEPGCGKTGFIKALANMDKMKDKHIINIKLSSNFDITQLNKIIFNNEIIPDLIIPTNKRIIIFEDIDCMNDIVKDRSSEEKEDKDTTISSKILNDAMIKLIKENENNNLSYLLNMLDGLKESDERIIIMTSNKPEMLDKALIRSGRIDQIIHFKKASTEDIINMLKHYWEVSPENITEDYDDLVSHADIINMCRSSDNIHDTCKLIDKYINNYAKIDDIKYILKSYWDYNNSIEIPESWNNIFKLNFIKSVCLKTNSIYETIDKLNE